MPTLHLGVIDQNYADPAPAPKRQPKARKGKQRPRKAAVSASDGLKTTGEVALLLEERYDIMAGFVKLHGQDIADAMGASVKDALDTVMRGGHVAANPLAQGAADVGELFREFIDKEELSQLEEGVPTQAALRGVNHSFKHPYSKSNPRRPSFVDTSLYRNSMLAWVD